MQQNLPRLILAGTNSGCGKTTVTCAVLQALVNRSLSVAAAKCGPDYIDPMFHSRIIGAKSSNLDPFFFDENTLRFLLAQNASGCDVTVIEGVMGYYDGLGLTSTRASTYELAQKTVSPVACGFLPNLPDCALKSRHLGLVTAAEVADLREKMQRLAAEAEQTIDLDALLTIAREAPALDVVPPTLPAPGAPVRIGVARDNAFCFYYEDSLGLLRTVGAELVPFSPLSDSALPAGLDGLYPAHEFHHWDAEQTGDTFTAAKPFGRSWPCVFATDTLYAGYPHFHFYANPSFAVRFLDACRKGKHHAGTDQTDGH